ncbi:IS21 family transposase [Aneurinibacillus sp. REN35]|uniref:IS21 family transposase n=1 Tax=Aneurinibacillus sp. REN35 TaxID=3237286 RepID=UPI00352978D3
MITRGEFFMLKDITDIARQMGIDRKTARKYIALDVYPRKQRRKKQPSKLDPFKQYLEKRIQEDGVYNCEKLYDEIQERGYTGGKTILKDFVQPFRAERKKRYTVRYETFPGEHMQVDWQEVETILVEGKKRKLYMFAATLGYSRMKYIEFTLSQDQEHVMQCLIHSFYYFGGVPQKVLFDNMKTVTDGREEGVVKWNRRFADFASYYGFIPKACRPYRAQTKGKIERAIQYVERSFYIGTHYDSLQDLNQQAWRWLDRVGNRKPNQTTGISPQERWAEEKLISTAGKLPYDTSYQHFRQVHFDGVYSYKGERRLLPYRFAGERVVIKERLDGLISLYHNGELIESYYRPPKGKSLADQIKKKQQGTAPTPPAVSEIKVAVRPLSDYDSFIGGGTP